MTNLIKIFPGAKSNQKYIAEEVLPYVVRPKVNSSSNSHTVKLDYVLRTGSHHGYPLNALIAYRLAQELNEPGNTVERIRELQASNLSILAENPSNIAALIQCMPKACNAAWLLLSAFPEGKNGKLKDSDFAYFLKSENSIVQKEDATRSMLLLAEIYSLLQDCNRIQPSDKFRSKLAALGFRVSDD